MANRYETEESLNGCIRRISEVHKHTQLLDNPKDHTSNERFY